MPPCHIRYQSGGYLHTYMGIIKILKNFKRRGDKMYISPFILNI